MTLIWPQTKRYQFTVRYKVLSYSTQTSDYKSLQSSLSVTSNFFPEIWPLSEKWKYRQKNLTMPDSEGAYSPLAPRAPGQYAYARSENS